MTTPLFAHGLAAAAVRHWTWEPVTAAVILASSIVYASGVRRLWRRAGTGRGIREWQVAAFAAGLLSVVVALLSPLAWLSEILFSAHMTQHEVLMLIAAPLLVFGRPLHVGLWAFDAPQRERIGRWTRGPVVARSWHALTAPLCAFSLHAAALWIWHAPAFFNAALAHDGIHALQHASFLLTAVLFWWGMLHGRYGRLGYGAGVVYVFLTALHSSILGALITIAPALWYAPYRPPAAAWNLDALVDQQLAGLFMWVPSGLVFIVFGLALLAAWLGESERRARLARPPQPAGGTLSVEERSA